MIRIFNTKGVGWMPDDIASAIFALFLIIIGFLVFNHTNELVTSPADKNVQELHEQYEQQRLLQTYIQTPIELKGETQSVQAYIAEFIMLDYYLTPSSKDVTRQDRRDILYEEIIKGNLQPVLNTYQPLGKLHRANAISFAEDIYFSITLVDTSTENIVHQFSYPVRLAQQQKAQATITLPTPTCCTFAPNQFIVQLTTYKPKMMTAPGMKINLNV